MRILIATPSFGLMISPLARPFGLGNMNLCLAICGRAPDMCGRTSRILCCVFFASYCIGVRKRGRPISFPDCELWRHIVGRSLRNVQSGSTCVPLPSLSVCRSLHRPGGLRGGWLACTSFRCGGPPWQPPLRHGSKGRGSGIRPTRGSGRPRKWEMRGRRRGTARGGGGSSIGARRCTPPPLCPTNNYVPQK